MNKTLNIFNNITNEEMAWGSEEADKMISILAKRYKLKIATDLFDEIWDSEYDERNFNSYNGDFLGRDYLIKHYNDKIYLALHRSGDIRGNYTDFLEVNDDIDDIREDLEPLIILTITSKGKKYQSISESSWDIPSFIPIEELDLSSEDLYEIYNQLM